MQESCFVYNVCMNIQRDNPPKYIEVCCSKCGDIIQRTNVSEKMIFVCFKCKRDRNRERTKELQKRRSTELKQGNNGVLGG
jgi:hypothetical protein